MKNMKFYAEIISRKIFKWIGFLIPIKQNRILFYSFTGTQYSCSPKYISEYLYSVYPEKYEFIWAFRDGVEDIPPYAKVVKYHGIRFFYYYLSAHVIISNIFPFHLIETRKNQIMIDTWHGGGAYKKAGFDFLNTGDKYAVKTMQFYQKSISAFVSSSQLFTQYFIRGGMQYHGTVIPAGLPRNDLFFYDEDRKRELCRKVYERLGMDDHDKLVLYAPTWRMEETDFEFSVERLKASLKKRFGGEWKVLVRMHQYTHRSMEWDVIDASRYPDMQELLLASEVLISDYSSSIWDYALTGKPCFLYAYDLDAYRSDRDFYIHIDQWGFPVCRNFEALLSAIEQFHEEEHRKKMKEHYEALGGYDCGNACKLVADYIVNWKG